MEIQTHCMLSRVHIYTRHLHTKAHIYMRHLQILHTKVYILNCTVIKAQLELFDPMKMYTLVQYSQCANVHAHVHIVHVDIKIYIVNAYAHVDMWTCGHKDLHACAAPPSPN